jgi:streptogramin lyase
MLTLRKILKPASIALGAFTMLAFNAPAMAGNYETRVVASGLNRPTGIVVQGSRTLYITQLPTPTIPGSMGGLNTVDRIKLGSGKITNLTTGEPEPTNLALDKKGNLYWTCKSAGVILERSRQGTVGLFLGGLNKPSGISVDRWGSVYFTQLPTPGVSGMMGGNNTVNVSDGETTSTLTTGEPEPTDIVVARCGTSYWTCKSAGVILKRTAAGVVSLLINGLNKPTGIALDDRRGRLYFTEVPTPGVSGANGGSNRVLAIDLDTDEVEVVNEGDPEPTDIAVAANGSVFWTCTSAGVIVQARNVTEDCDWNGQD